MKIECPSCYFEFSPDADIVVGEIVTCPDCGVDLEVLEINGDVVKVKTAEVGSEDWGE
jgi:alpha-aminoadipate carrier protein LysW